jgi:twitching motility protein PilT
LINFFPGEEQAVVRERLAQNLMAVVSLRLLAGCNGFGRLPGAEVMLVTRSIEECIRNPEKTSEIQHYIQRGTEIGMQTFDQHLVQLLREGKISLEAAKLAATIPAELELMLTIE